MSTERDPRSDDLPEGLERVAAWDQSASSDRHGWCLSSAGVPVADVFPFRSESDRDAFVAAVAARLTPEVNTHQEAVAAFVALTRWGDGTDQSLAHKALWAVVRDLQLVDDLHTLAKHWPSVPAPPEVGRGHTEPPIHAESLRARVAELGRELRLAREAAQGEFNARLAGALVIEALRGRLEKYEPAPRINWPSFEGGPSPTTGPSPFRPFDRLVRALPRAAEGPAAPER